MLHEIEATYSQNIITFVTLGDAQNYCQRTWTALVLAHFSEESWSKSETCHWSMLLPAYFNSCDRVSCEDKSPQFKDGAYQS